MEPLIILKMHKPVKKMVKVYQIGRVRNFNLKLKLLVYLEHFMPHNKYVKMNAACYGKYGPVTFESFGKVRQICKNNILMSFSYFKHLFWYIKTLMFAYKFVKYIVEQN